MPQPKDSILSLVKSPVSDARLQPASSELVDKINDAISIRGVQNRGGRMVDELLDSGLVDSESRYLFPIRQGISILVADQAIALEES